jgi:hypothetical protein
MAIVAAESPFVDLRRLVEWFVTSPTRPSLQVERIVTRLGATAIPLLGRELAGADPHRRAAARAALARLGASPARARVIAELHRITDGTTNDACKVCALGLLAELGERGVARFSDPSAIQRSSALALAAQLDTPGDVAAAADLMVAQLADDDLVKLVGVMADASPAPAHRIASELCARLDVALELRERIAEVALLHTAPDEPASRKPARPTHVHVLVDDHARTVIVAIRKLSGERRWRRWAVLLDTTIDDCIHEDFADEPDASALVRELIGDGYRVVSTAFDVARARIAAAARATGERLPAAYYVGRDLLELGDVHLSRARVHPTSATIGRAVELIADGDVPRARLLLARCDGESSDVAAATAACLLAQARPADAVPHLVRASELEPAWPLHHWNLAAACHAIGDVATCYQALRRFVATSHAPTGLAADPDQPARVAHAGRLMAELERTARLAGKRLRKRP